MPVIEPDYDPCGVVRPHTLGYQRCLLPEGHEGKQHQSQDGKFYSDATDDELPVLTAEELIELLGELPPDARVVWQDSEAMWYGIKAISLTPDEDRDYWATVGLVP